MADSIPKNGRTGYRIFFFFLLLITWVIFSGLLDPFHLTLGVISCGLVTWLSSDMMFSDRTIPFGVRARQTYRLINYLIWLLWQIILSNIDLLKLSFLGPKSLSPQIVRYETSLKTDFEKFMLANSITITPGTVTLKIIGQTFYIHAISDSAAKGLDGEMERRIARIFAR